MDRRSLLFVIVLVVALFFLNQWFFSDKNTAPVSPPQKKYESLEPVSGSSAPEPPSRTQTNEEQFYVLENDFQQLVFSNLGGAIAQINLPFKDEAHPESVVLPIGFDKTLEKNSPQ